MPYISNGKWKWGNLERKSKDDLRKLVYGIWMKGGSKGNFSDFWEKGKVTETTERTNGMDKYAVAGYDEYKKKLQVKVLSLDEVLDLLKKNKYDGYTQEQIDKLKKKLENPKGYYVDFKSVRFRIKSVKFRILKIDV